MAERNLLNFLTRFHEELKIKSKEYRTITADKLVHHFVFSDVQLGEETLKQLRRMGRELTSRDIKVVEDGATAAGHIIANVISGYEGDHGISRIYIQTGLIDFSFTEELDVGDLGKFKPDQVFGKVKKTYDGALGSYFKKLQDYFTKIDAAAGISEEARGLRTKSGEQMKSHGQMWNAGHEHGTGIYESILRVAFEASAKETDYNTATNKSVAEAEILSLLSAHNIDLHMIRDGNTDNHTIFIESNNWNKVYGGKARKYQRSINSRVSKLKDKLAKSISNLSGSDSPIEKFGKETLKEAIDPFVRRGNAKVTGKSLVINNQTREVSLPVEGGVGQGKKQTYNAIAGGALAGIAARRTARAKARSGVSLKRLIPIINKQLPDVVAKNMKLPRLENRTGRLASSAKVVDITKTAGGFASIGYTYMRDPYEAFEASSGTRFSDSNRDPRSLIDVSVREIASQHGIPGRLYTRRL